MKDQIFTIRPGTWQICVGGQVLPHDFNSQGAAAAGLKTE